LKIKLEFIGTNETLGPVSISVEAPAAMKRAKVKINEKIK